MNPTTILYTMISKFHMHGASPTELQIMMTKNFKDALTKQLSDTLVSTNGGGYVLPQDVGFYHGIMFRVVPEEDMRFMSNAKQVWWEDVQIDCLMVKWVNPIIQIKDKYSSPYANTYVYEYDVDVSEFVPSRISDFALSYSRSRDTSTEEE